MNENILFIDDDIKLLNAYVRQFKKKYNVQTASSGGEAIRIILEGKLFPVIISNFNMPLMSGIEFFEAINNISPQTIKILVTDDADVNIAIDAINKGNIFRFITKPHDKKVLRTAIEDALHQHKLTSLEKSDLLKSEFLNIISREIGTPLNGHNNFINLIKDTLPDEAYNKVSSYFSIIDENKNRLVKTIRLMIDISNVMSKTLKFNYEPFDIASDILAPLLKNYRPKAERKKIAIDLNMDSSEYKIISDKYCFEQIFSKLLENAITFSNDGLISIAITQDENNFIIKLSDTGIGMDEDFLKKMFKPFLQEVTGNSRTYDGNGLGLTLVKEYCNLLNIGIKVESKKHVGTTFHLTIKKDE